MWWFEIFETFRRLAFTGGLLFVSPGTRAQIVVSMLLCLGGMRVYAGYKPFIQDHFDLLAETVQWQLFLTMFAALALWVDEETMQDKKLFDYMVCFVQFVGPAFVGAFELYNTTWKKSAKKKSCVEDDEGGIELGEVFRDSGPSIFYVFSGQKKKKVQSLSLENGTGSLGGGVAGVKPLVRGEA